MGRGLGWGTHRGPCQPLLFCDFVTGDGSWEARGGGGTRQEKTALLPIAVAVGCGGRGQRGQGGRGAAEQPGLGGWNWGGLVARLGDRRWQEVPMHMCLGNDPTLPSSGSLCAGGIFFGLFLGLFECLGFQWSTQRCGLPRVMGIESYAFRPSLRTRVARAAGVSRAGVPVLGRTGQKTFSVTAVTGTSLC